MSFDNLNEALQAHVEGEPLPEDAQRWLMSGLAAFVNGEPLERALKLTRGRFQRFLRDKALCLAFEHVDSVDSLYAAMQAFNGDPSSELECHLSDAIATGARMPDRRHLRRIVGRKPSKPKPLTRDEFYNSLLT